MSLNSGKFKPLMRKTKSKHVCVNDLTQAIKALVAAEQAGCPVRLECPPGMLEIQGAAWFMALVKEAKQKVPAVQVETLIDAGSMPGLALEALSQGADILRIDGGVAAASKLKAIAKAQGARLLTKRTKAK